MPLATLEAFADHGEARRTVDEDVEGARRVIEQIEALGIDFAAVTHGLQVEGVDKFVDPFREMLRHIEEKLVEVAART